MSMITPQEWTNYSGGTYSVRVRTSVSDSTGSRDSRESNVTVEKSEEAVASKSEKSPVKKK